MCTQQYIKSTMKSTPKLQQYSQAVDMCGQQYSKIHEIFSCIGPIQQPMQYSNTGPQSHQI